PRLSVHVFSSSRYRLRRVLDSFPTRRSSDLFMTVRLCSGERTYSHVSIIIATAIPASQLQCTWSKATKPCSIPHHLNFIIMQLKVGYMHMMRYMRSVVVLSVFPYSYFCHSYL